MLESIIAERQPARIEIDLPDGSEEDPRRWIHHHDKRAQLPQYPQRTHFPTKRGSLDADHQPHFICKFCTVLRVMLSLMGMLIVCTRPDS